MAELQLGGKTIATQSGTNNPVLSSNVVMDNVNVNNALASATYPAGHVIKTVTDVYDPSSANNISDTGNDELGSLLEVTIQPNSTSNKLIIHCFIPGVYASANVRALKVGFRYGDFSSASDNGTQLGTEEFVTGLQSYQNAGAGNIRDNLHVMHIVNAPSTNSFKIRPWFARHGSATVQIFNDGLGIASLSVQEIQS